MVNQKETLRGNERIQQLMEEFPEIPRTLVIKADLCREAIRPTETTRMLGRRVMPESPWYFEYSRENVHSGEELAPGGYLLSPLMGYFSNGVAWQFAWFSRSPYEVRYEGVGRYQLYRDDEPIEEVSFPNRPLWYDRKTSSGKPMPTIMTQKGESLVKMVALNHCEYFNDDNGCRYCNIVPAERIRKGFGLQRVTAKRDEDIYETLTAAIQEGCVRTVFASGGVILDVRKEAAAYARIAEVVKRAMKDVGQEFPFGVAMQAAEREDHVRMKEAGVSSMAHDLEVWDPRLFEIICPGKAKYVGRERWLERLLSAVEVFGEGRVASNFVVGVDLLHPDGFKTEDEALGSYLEGRKWMHQHGITPSGLIMQCGPGTMFEGMSPPPTEYFLRAELASYKLAVEYHVVPEPGGRPDGNPGFRITNELACFGLREARAAGPAERVC